MRSSLAPSLAPYVALSLLLGSTPACIALDGCEDLTVGDGSGGGAASASTSTAPSPSSTGTTPGVGGDAATTEAGPGGGEGGAGGGEGGGSCTPLGDEICGNDVDEDCQGGAAECPVGVWWRFFEDVPPPSIATGVATRPADLGPVAAVLLYDGEVGLGYGVATWSPSGVPGWNRQFPVDDRTYDSMFVANAVGADDVVIAGTTFAQLTIDDETFGMADRQTGFVAQLASDDGGLVDLLVIDSDGASTISGIAQEPGSDWFAVIGSASDEISIGGALIPARTGFLVVFGADLEPIVATRLSASATDETFIFPTAVAMRGQQIVVAFAVEGPYEPLDGTSSPFDPLHASAGLQVFSFSGNNMVPSSFHALAGGGFAGEVVWSLAIDGAGRTHGGVKTDDAPGLRFDDVPVEDGSLAPDDTNLYFRFTAEGPLERAESFGAALELESTSAEIVIDPEDDDALLFTGQASGDVLGEAANGAFLAELDVAASPLDVRWFETFGPSSLAGGVAFGPPGARSLHVAGGLRGHNPIDGEQQSAAVPAPFVARYDR